MLINRVIWDGQYRQSARFVKWYEAGHPERTRGTRKVCHRERSRGTRKVCHPERSRGTPSHVVPRDPSTPLRSAQDDDCFSAFQIASSSSSFASPSFFPRVRSSSSTRLKRATNLSVAACKVSSASSPVFRARLTTAN